MTTDGLPFVCEVCHDNDACTCPEGPVAPGETQQRLRWDWEEHTRQYLEECSAEERARFYADNGPGY